MAATDAVAAILADAQALAAGPLEAPDRAARKSALVSRALSLPPPLASAPAAALRALASVPGLLDPRELEDATARMLGLAPVAPAVVPVVPVAPADPTTTGKGPRKSFKVAVVLSPPEGAWGPVQEIRRRHDKAYGRWMPHVNVVWPFAPEDAWGPARAVERLRAAAARAVRFRATLGAFRWFEHSSSCVMWLEPACEPAGALQQLREELAREFPEYAGAGHEGPWTPHLTVGQWAKKDVARAADGLREGWAPIAWEATELHLICRQGDDEPFHVAHVIPIGH
eukprot:m51a1_g14263 putative polynucleotide adenyltransferase (283) ;mRNA; f:300588-301436